MKTYKIILYSFFFIIFYKCSNKSDNEILYMNHYFIKIANNQDIYMSKYEISNDQFAFFLNSSFNDGDIRVDSTYVISSYSGDRYYKSGEKLLYKLNEKSPILFSDGKFSVISGKGSLPIVNVSWYGAFKYCQYYGFVLPSEKDWLDASKELVQVSNEILNVKDVTEFQDSSSSSIYNLNSNVSEWINPFYNEDWPYKQIRGSSFKNILSPYNKKIGNFAPQMLNDVGFRPVYYR
ncbi:MAG: hypothetical protein CMG24_03295 [Candidatus Marinimicrobia bacterium]|jgi:formylglycine-generating enzyme required for sulfatase activity|nr:hypothetical protein [Candidatus Neomarinimicrobiota bacterium]